MKSLRSVWIIHMYTSSRVFGIYQRNSPFCTKWEIIFFYCHEKRGLAAKESKKCLPIHFVYLMYIICQDSIIMWSTLNKHVEISKMLLPWLEHFWNLPIALNNRSRRQLIERQRKNRLGIKRRFFLYQQFNVDATERFIISTSTSSKLYVPYSGKGYGTPCNFVIIFIPCSFV